MKTATGNAILRAYNAVAGKIAKDRRLLATEVSAGYIIPDDETDGWEVFVRMEKRPNIRTERK